MSRKLLFMLLVLNAEVIFKKLKLWVLLFMSGVSSVYILGKLKVTLPPSSSSSPCFCLNLTLSTNSWLLLTCYCWPDCMKDKLLECCSFMSWYAVCGRQRHTQLERDHKKVKKCEDMKTTHIILTDRKEAAGVAGVNQHFPFQGCGLSSALLPLHKRLQFSLQPWHDSYLTH